MPGPAAFGTYYIIMATINAATGLLNGKLSRNQQNRITQESRELQESMERNRQNFQLSLNEKNTESQRDLSLQNHQLRIEEQRVNFENMCKQTEWTRFLNTWPLMNVPSVIREEQISKDNKVSLRVIFSRNNDKVFTSLVYPRIEAGLREFVDLYHNIFGSQNIIFYDNGFTGSITGGAMEENLHYALKELPVIIIDLNVLHDEIRVSLSMWGLGSDRKSHFTVFKIPYQVHIENGTYALDYYNRITDQILAYLKFVLGYAYDVYNLIQYDQAPLLPQVAAFEFKQKDIRGKLLSEEQVRSSIKEKYEEMYSAIIGLSDTSKTVPFALLPESCKTSLLHILRMEYAESVRTVITDDLFIQYLNEALEAWAYLRSTKEPVVFLNALYNGDLPISQYVDRNDADFINRLTTLYLSTDTSGLYSELLPKLCNRISQTEFQNNIPTHANERPNPEKKQKRDFSNL